MAIWRWSTMDCWNPFSRRFWHWGNLFNESHLERIAQIKLNVITALFKQIQFSHPKQEQAKISCPLTHEPIRHPVITLEGRVYEKYALLQRIAGFNGLPGNQGHLTLHDVYDFNELNGVLEYAKARQLRYEQKEQALIQLAMETAMRPDIGLQYAEVFTCPLSKRLINNPVISPKGRVFDKEAIVGYFESTGAQHDPIDGSPLVLTALLPFNEYRSYLSLYRNKAAEMGEHAIQVANHGVDIVRDGLEFIGSFFHAPKIPGEDVDPISRPGMRFTL